MKQVLLIYGNPRQGKTYLMTELVECYSFHGVSVDHIYVDFTRTELPELYFEYLDSYIAPHYDCILSQSAYSMREFGRNFVTEWNSHLMTRVLELTAQYDNLAVEGYLLRHCLRELEMGLAVTAQVFPVHVVNQTYRVHGKPVSIEEVARLGRSEI